MKIGLLGYYPEYQHNNMENINFSSSKTILDYDVLFIDLDNLFSNYKIDSYYNGFPRISDYDSVCIKIDVGKRKKEISTFLESGKNIIVFGTKDNYVYRYTGKKESTGTGRNSKTTYFVEDIHPKTILPLQISSLDLSGNSISFSNKQCESIFHKYVSFLEYRNVYENVDKSKIIMNIKDSSNSVVSYYEKITNGFILFAPTIVFQGKDKKKESRLEKNYHDCLCNFLKTFTIDNVSLPEYSTEYFVPKEEIMQKDLEILNKKMLKLQEEINRKNAGLKDLQQEKIFFTGTGKDLEICCVNLFKKIGFNIDNYDSTSVNEDIQVSIGDDKAVVEVKGVSGSATEKHSTQLVKWKLEYQLEHDIMPKAILVVNAFNERKLEDRQEYFPEQMLKFAMHQEVCLLTTIQLYNLSKYIEKNPEKKDELIKKIFDTNGKFIGYEKWQENICKKEVEND